MLLAPPSSRVQVRTCNFSTACAHGRHAHYNIDQWALIRVMIHFQPTAAMATASAAELLPAKRSKVKDMSLIRSRFQCPEPSLILMAALTCSDRCSVKHFSLSKKNYFCVYVLRSLATVHIICTHLLCSTALRYLHS